MPVAQLAQLIPSMGSLRLEGSIDEDLPPHSADEVMTPVCGFQSLEGQGERPQKSVECGRFRVRVRPN